MLTRSRAGLQRTQLVLRLRGDHEHWQATIGFNCLKALHDLESVHPGHLEIQDDQVVAVLAVERANLKRIHRQRYGSVAGARQHALQETDIGFLIVDDQDFGVQNSGWTEHGMGLCLALGADTGDSFQGEVISLASECATASPARPPP